MIYKYYESEDLVDRLCSVSNQHDKSVIFLVGSPLSLPDHVGGHGVPGVSGMIDIIRHEFKDTDAEAEFDKALEGDLTNRYRRAFEFLHGRRGQDAANKIVRAAVWQALDAKNWPHHLPPTSPQDANSAICQALQDDADAWALPNAVDLLGNLLVTCSDTFGGTVLTTNFDPLIEVSLSKHGGESYRTVLHDDGKLGQTVAKGTHIVYLHGYWQDYDTLHTPQQLIQPRPQLKRSLARVVEASTLAVVGYSGWDDVITQTLMELLSDPSSNPEILWAFHDADIETISKSNKQLLSILEPGIGRGRVSLYRGIDCRSLISSVYEQLKPNYPAAHGLAKDPCVTTVVKEDTDGKSGQRQVSIEMNFPIPQQTSAESDRPLIVDPWVGRTQELNILASSITPVAFVTGLGGQGKSALAGQFLKQQAMTLGRRFEFWDWRDCREQSDRLGTQILRLVERLTDGAINISQIEVTDIRAVIGMLFHVLQDRKALLVFDNVDQYIDLETLEPVKGLDILVSEVQAHSHQSLFLFTCRPDVRVDESRAVRVSLGGLTEDETKALIKAHPALQKDHHMAKELYRTTNGHPLWVNLIAMQAIQNEDGLSGALTLIKQGGATLPDTTKTIWGMLNDQQQDVLRTMAELDRPEPESRLLDLLPGVNANRVNRALKTLRSFHLIEIRTQPAGEPLLGLHPIIREFIRTSFLKEEREPYVGAILDSFDRMIGRFKDLLPQEPSYKILEYWTRKAQLQITFGQCEEATSTIAEIGPSLVDRGYVEEMIRITVCLFTEIDWAEACSSYKEFDSIFFRCLYRMIQIGHDSYEDYLSQYEAAIPGKSSQFILLCELRCYADWSADKFDSAIRWGEEGARLKKATSVDTVYSTRHNLALSLRDAGHVQKALDSFLMGESLVAVVKPGKVIDGKHAHFYGNIGRCLFIMNRLDEALVCYVKSAQILEGSRSYEGRLNKGFIRYWIAELLMLQEKFELAAAFYRCAVCVWSDSSPPRANKITEKLENLVAAHPELHTYLNEVDWKTEETYRRWLDSQ